MLVCFAEPVYAFKNECRWFLFIDSWELREPYPTVMLVAAAMDENDGILPIAFCEVLTEGIDRFMGIFPHQSYQRFKNETWLAKAFAF